MDGREGTSNEMDGLKARVVALSIENRGMAESNVWKLAQRYYGLRERLGMGRRPKAEVASFHAPPPERWTNTRQVAVVVSGSLFDPLRNQRPMGLARALVGMGFAVLYCVVGHSLFDFDMVEVWPSVWQVSLGATRRLLEQERELERGQRILVAGLPTPEVADLASLASRLDFMVIYDVMDDWSAFQKAGYAPWYRERVERELAARADMVFAVSPRLVERVRGWGRGAVLVRNGLDPAQYSHGWDGLSARRGVVYWGHMSPGWFDWHLVHATAARVSDSEFLCLGYGMKGLTSHHPGNLTVRQGIWGAELAAVASSFRIGIVPFKDNDIARSADPIKLYEYLYFGLPCVCTGLADLDEFPEGGVVRCRREEFPAKVEEAVRQEVGEEERRRMREAILRRYTYRSRLEAAFGEMGLAPR